MLTSCGAEIAILGLRCVVASLWMAVLSMSGMTGPFGSDADAGLRGSLPPTSELVTPSGGGIIGASCVVRESPNTQGDRFTRRTEKCQRSRYVMIELGRIGVVQRRGRANPAGTDRAAHDVTTASADSVEVMVSEIPINLLGAG